MVTPATMEPAVDEFHVPFVGRWQNLVSTTNWEKGRIILQWRLQLIDQGRDGGDYSDEAWSRVVGGVSPQHVGRLRRVYERFGENHESFAGLYWTHFLAAMDWDDAELWLEGAVQNRWSAPKMRAARWEATGADEEEQTAAEPLVEEEFDGDVDPAFAESTARTIDGEPTPVSAADADDVNAAFDESAPWEPGAEGDDSDSVDAPELVQPFAGLPSLPPDLDEALEVCRAAILRHKMNHWRDVSADDVLAHLDGLKQLALAPSGD